MIQEQITFLVNRTSSEFVFCEKCGDENLMFKPETIAKVADMNTREIYRRIETGEIHFRERNADELFVCIQTLLGEQFPQENNLPK